MPASAHLLTHRDKDAALWTPLLCAYAGKHPRILQRLLELWKPGGYLVGFSSLPSAFDLVNFLVYDVCLIYDRLVAVE